MRKICLQAGHEGRTSGATGAPGEAELNIRIRDALAEVLTQRGFEVHKTNADPHKTPKDTKALNTDWDLFLALHGDADVYGTGGGFVDWPDPSADFVNAESKRIAQAIESEYFNHSQIENRPDRRNANTKFYYMWSELTAKTPCVIIEMGVVQNAHDKVLLADTNRIVSALARGILKAFGESFDDPESDDHAKQAIDLLRVYQEQNNFGNLESAQRDLLAKPAEVDRLTKELQNIRDQQSALKKIAEMLKNIFK